MKPSPFRPVDESDFRLYNLFRDEVFPLRQKYQDFEDGKYFPSEAAANLLVKASLIFDHVQPYNPALLFNTEQILSSFISADGGTKSAFDRALAAFAQLVKRPREQDGEGIIVIDDSDDERTRRRRRSKGKGKEVDLGEKEREEGTPDVQFLGATEEFDMREMSV